MTLVILTPQKEYYTLVERRRFNKKAYYLRRPLLNTSRISCVRHSKIIVSEMEKVSSRRCWNAVREKVEIQRDGSWSRLLENV
jgi:hypothetical protein